MLAYCDYIAYTIKKNLMNVDEERMLREVGKVEYDLNPVTGSFQSTKKTIEVTDKYGKAYKVTVEEM